MRIFPDPLDNQLWNDYNEYATSRIKEEVPGESGIAFAKLLIHMHIMDTMSIDNRGPAVLILRELGSGDAVLDCAYRATCFHIESQLADDLADGDWEEEWCKKFKCLFADLINVLGWLRASAMLNLKSHWANEINERIREAYQGQYMDAHGGEWKEVVRLKSGRSYSVYGVLLGMCGHTSTPHSHYADCFEAMGVALQAASAILDSRAKEVDKDRFTDDQILAKIVTAMDVCSELDLGHFRGMVQSVYDDVRLKMGVSA